MSVQVNLPGILARLTGGETRLEAEGATVGDVVSDLARRFPKVESRLRDPSGAPYQFVSIYVNDRDIRFEGGFDIALADNDEITVVPAVAGG